MIVQNIEIQKIYFNDINLNKYKTYTFPYLTKMYKKHKQNKYEIYYNDMEFIKIYKNESGEKLASNIDIFIKNNLDIFKKLCPAVTHLIYKSNNQLIGYITIRGLDLDNNKYWGMGCKFNPQDFFYFLDRNKDILLKLLHKKHYYYSDLKQKNVIVFNNSDGNQVYSFIDLEAFCKIKNDENPSVNIKKCGINHWYVKEINKYNIS